MSESDRPRQGDEGSLFDPTAALMTAVAAGDRKAFDQLYSLTSARVFGIILQVLINRALAEEVLQDVYLYVWSNAAKFTSARGVTSAWLSTIAYRRAVDCVRATQSSSDRDRRVGSWAAESSSDTAFDAVNGHAERKQLHDALTRLTPEQLVCIDLAYGEGLSQSQIAQRTGQALGTVKSRTRAALSELRTHLPTRAAT